MFNEQNYETINFDYSEKYFESELALERIKSFLPNAHIFIIYPTLLAFDPDTYFSKLKIWLDTFDKIVIVSEEGIYNRPSKIMNSLQARLNINGTLNYSNLLLDRSNDLLDNDLRQQSDCHNSQLQSFLESTNQLASWLSES